MKILLGSTNGSKKKSLEGALKELNLNDYEIICLNSKSGVSSKPIGFEIIRGADNRNQESKKYASQKGIDYEYLCAIEGGFSLDENGLPFVVTYVIIEDAKGKKSTGKSLGIRLRKDMFDFIKNGGSLNDLINKINGNNNAKYTEGITGFLTNGLLKRADIDRGAIISALIPILFREKREVLSKMIAKYSGKNYE